MNPDLRLERWQQRTEWPLAGAAVVFLVLYSVRVLTDPQSWVSVNAARALWVVWAAFGVDYLGRLSLAADRRRWFFRHLVDLAVLALPVFQPLRMLRLLVLIVALQKAIGNAIRGKVVVYTASSVVLLVYVASLAVLQAERGHPHAEINNFGDAVWWSISTVTTVGYGDFEPVTIEGRVVAVLLMIGGISLLGAVTATMASWIVQRVEDDDNAVHAATEAHINAMRSDFERRTDAMVAEIQRLTQAVNALESARPSSPD